MINYLLEVKKDEELTGELGLVVKNKEVNRPYFQPATTSSLLTHDILEHPYRQITGDIEDELMAIGGVYYIRYLGQYETTKYRYTELRDLSSDICEILRYLNNGYKLNNPKQYSTKNKYVNKDIQKVVKDAIKLYINEFEELLNCDNTLIKYIQGWIFKGYSYTKKRYYKYDYYTLSYIFKNIEEELNNLYKNISYEGQQFKLKINLNQIKIYWKEVEEWDI